jgi:hypothetical protein
VTRIWWQKPTGGNVKVYRKRTVYNKGVRSSVQYMYVLLVKPPSWQIESGGNEHWREVGRALRCSTVRVGWGGVGWGELDYHNIKYDDDKQQDKCYVT